MHKHPEIEQTFVIEGSFYDHDGICRAGEFVWRRVGSFHETHSDEGAIILAVYRKPNVLQHSTGYARSSIASAEAAGDPAATTRQRLRSLLLQEQGPQIALRSRSPAPVRSAPVRQR